MDAVPAGGFREPRRETPRAVLFRPCRVRQLCEFSLRTHQGGESQLHRPSGVRDARPVRARMGDASPAHSAIFQQRRVGGAALAGYRACMPAPSAAKVAWVVLARRSQRSEGCTGSIHRRYTRRLARRLVRAGSRFGRAAAAARVDDQPGPHDASRRDAHGCGRRHARKRARGRADAPVHDGRKRVAARRQMVQSEVLQPQRTGAARERVDDAGGGRPAPARASCRQVAWPSARLHESRVRRPALPAELGHTVCDSSVVRGSRAASDELGGQVRGPHDHGIRQVFGRDSHFGRQEALRERSNVRPRHLARADAGDVHGRNVFHRVCSCGACGNVLRATICRILWETRGRRNQRRNRRRNLRNVRFVGWAARGDDGAPEVALVGGDGRMPDVQRQPDLSLVDRQADARNDGLGGSYG